MQIKYILLFLLAINIISFWVSAIDKWLAKRQKWRVSEKSLFILALLGGALLMYTSMRIFHHKTLHKRFMIGLPFITVLHILIMFVLNFYGIIY